MQKKKSMKIVGIRGEDGDSDEERRREKSERNLCDSLYFITTVHNIYLCYILIVVPCVTNNYLFE